MTKMQHDDDNSHCSPTPTIIIGSFNDDRSYAMKMTTDDGDLPDNPTTATTTTTPRLIGEEGMEEGGVARVGVGVGVGSRMAQGVVNPVMEELQHPSEMSVENSITGSRGSGDSQGSSCTKVDFTDIGDSYNFTTSTLRKCKHKMLKPYWGLLMFIGWRVFRHDVITPRSLPLRTLNIIYPSLIILLLLYTYAYEMIACEWKLDVTKDTEILPSPTPPTPHPKNVTGTTTLIPDVTLRPAYVITTPLDSTTSPQPCEHIVTTYIIPNLLHLLSYVMGLYYFRIQDNEQMFALMEKVFLQANPLHSSSSSQQKLVRRTRMFLVFGSLWVLMTSGLQVLYVWAFNFPTLAIFNAYGRVFHWATFSVELLGRVVFNSVLLAVVVNYVTQCEMVMFYVKGLALRLQEKSADLKTAFKDTLLLRQNLSLLNGIISKMTTLALVILAELTIIGLSILALNRYDQPKVWAYRSLFPVVWGSMLCFPLFQAARVNSVCLRIKKISLEMRVFGYKNCSQLELDSFLQFVHSTRLRAKLFHVPIHPSYIIAISILGAFIFLVLVQTSSVVSNNYIV